MAEMHSSVGAQPLKEFKEPRSESVQTKKKPTVDTKRKRQKRKEDEDQLGVKRKAMDKAKVGDFTIDSLLL
jgi:hypothetical protein